MSDLDPSERAILEALDSLVQLPEVRAELDRVVARVEARLSGGPTAGLAWEPVPLALYPGPVPTGIRSSWVFVLRGGAASGSERHPRSHQRMVSYRGEGDLQTRTGGPWRSHPLRSDPAAPLEERWISIPPGVWHQAVVAGAHWAVVSFQTAATGELVEQRPDPADETLLRDRRYEPG